LPLTQVTVPVTITCVLLPGTNVAVELTEKFEMPANPGLAEARIRPLRANAAEKHISGSLFIFTSPFTLPADRALPRRGAFGGIMIKSSAERGSHCWLSGTS
jgi:hypothetical protein